MRGVSLIEAAKELVARVATAWKLKLVLTLALNAFFWIGYGWLARNAFFPARILPLTWVDTIIPFSPELWSAIYLSEFLLTLSVPWLIRERTRLVFYAKGVAVLSISSFLIFLFFPVASPRTISSAHEFGLYQWIVTTDGRYNAFPSLHAGFLIFTLLVMHRLFAARVHIIIFVALWIWALLVLYSTIAIRQHYFIDLLAGSVLGSIAYQSAFGRLVWREARTTLRRKRFEFQEGLR
jgi:membrane-associated phospholipid phosphatase